MTQGYMPNRLPPSCLTMAPRFDTKMSQIARRGPLQEINKEPGIKTTLEKRLFIFPIEIHCGRGECGLNQKYAFIKKSTIFTQS